MIAVVIEEPGRPLRRLQFSSLPIVLGRGEEADVRVADDQVSRGHARIEDSPAGPRLRDLGAANGTFRDGERIACALLRRGARIVLGNTTVTFVGRDEDGPDQDQGAVLRFEFLDEGTPRWIEVGRLPAVIGRDDAADLPLSDDQVSRAHARLEEGPDGRVVLQDAGSANGSQVNGKKVRSATLAPDDDCRFGNTRLRFRGGSMPHLRARADVAVPGLEVVSPLGAGVLSDVYLAEQVAMGRNVALRVMRPEGRDSLDVRERFARQARGQSRIRHEALAAGIDVGERDGVPFFITEALAGEPLDALASRSVGRSLAEVVRVGRALLELAAAVHGKDAVLGGVVPRRVMVSEDRVALTRLGFPASSAQKLPLRAAEERAYLAPEARSGDPEAAGPRGDLYQIGACLHAFVTGSTPPDPDPETGAVPAPAPPGGRPLPRAFGSWLEDLLRADPARRPASANEALERLEQVSSGVKAAGARRMVDAGALGDAPLDHEAAARQRRVKLLSRVLSVVILLGSNGALGWWWWARGPGSARWKERKQAEAPETPTETAPRTDVDEPEPSRPVAPPTPELLAAEREAAAAWEAERSEIAALAEPAERIRRLIVFAEAHVGTKANQEALLRVSAEKRAWKSRADRLLDRLEKAVDSESLASARRAIIKAEPVARGIADARLDALAERLAKKAGTFQPKASGPGGDPDPDRGQTAPASEATTKPSATPRGAAKDVLRRALARPADARRRADALAVPAADAAQRFSQRMLRAWEAVVPAGLEALEGSGRPVVLGAGDEAPRGQVARFDGDAVTLRLDGQESVVPLGELDWGALAPVVRAAPTSAERYLLRAQTAQTEKRWDDAWFDLQGFRLLAGEDAWPLADALLDALSRLRRKGGR